MRQALERTRIHKAAYGNGYKAAVDPPLRIYYSEESKVKLANGGGLWHNAWLYGEGLQDYLFMLPVSVASGWLPAAGRFVAPFPSPF